MQSGRLIYTPDLYNLFRSHCGSCHADQGLGDWRRATLDEFIDNASKDIDSVLSSLTSDDPDVVMPPYAQTRKLWKDRGPEDPVRELVALLTAWYGAGAPQDVFNLPPGEGEADPSKSPYVIDETLAARLTNIGNCLPDKKHFATDTSTMDKLDARFAALKTSDDLPPSLTDTDVTSLDSAALAATGLFAFAPEYPLWSGNAGKLRYVRVPRGQTIRFDRDAQAFVFPPNTRFYKTFMQKVMHEDGTSFHYRKLETRIIVARPDGPDAPDGSHTTQALFGVYAWDETETTATLVRDPLRDGTRFRDRLVSYINNEQLAAPVLSGPAPNKILALRQAKAMATWAIPGSARCVQCHMGSPSKNFVLGFTPLQIRRRVTGEGGAYEPTGVDELYQLQRLSALGVVSGVSKPDDIVLLESSQGTRTPRNPEELKAQAYALGNCANCHNPRGYPTINNPGLRELLNFWPNKETGGLFRFPLDRVSPRIKRGPNQNVDIPYITPSLIDFGATRDPDFPKDSFSARVSSDSLDLTETAYIAAPWRSLIYRNVDTPFMYVFDAALFPHMPMNVAGFDTRVPGIFGDWMVSIPARLKLVKGREWNYEAITVQPYEEVTSDDPTYEQVVAASKKRLALYQEGGVAPYDFMASGPHDEVHKTTRFLNYRRKLYAPETSDIIDWTLNPVNGDFRPLDLVALPSLRDEELAMSEPTDPVLHKFAAEEQDGVPDRPHWAVTDITDSPPPWYPRRSDWETVLVKQEFIPPPNGAPFEESKLRKQKLAVALLQDITLTERFRAFATTPAPFTTWVEKPGCDLSAFPTVSSLPPDQRRPWMPKIGTNTTDSAATTNGHGILWSESPGGVVYKEICINCHGVKLDSRGRQADNLMLITGGTTRVANFRDGLFGPSHPDENGAPPVVGGNIAAVFASAPTTQATAEDWAARYTAWMALGGTLTKVDSGIMGLVAAAPALDIRRPGVVDPDVGTDANMLAVATALCRQSVGLFPGYMGTALFDLGDGDVNWKMRNAGLVRTNGDLDTWRKVCTFDNPPPVAVMLAGSKADRDTIYGLYPATGYPTTAPIGGPGNQVYTGVTADNPMPWCMDPPNTDEERAILADIVRLYRNGQDVPLCPSDWLASTKPATAEELERWTTRGAINAGFSVFLYVQEQIRNLAEGKPNRPSYDACEQLKH